MESLALRYRPHTFEDLVGQRPVQVILRQMVTVGAVPAALLFDGSRGTGKTSTARILAAALNCEEPAPPCTRCVTCKSIAEGNSPDVLEIDAASNGLVDDIRELRQHLLYAATGRHRVIILDEAHSMSTAAFNALLKTLEEPPAGVVFILLTTEPGRIPDTVASRCMPFTFRRLAVTDILDRLTHVSAAEELDTEPALLYLIAQRADGALRDAIIALDQATRAGISTAAGYAELVGHTDTAPALLSALAGGDTAGAYTLVDAHLTRSGDANHLTNTLVGALRDTLILHAGGTPPVSGQSAAERVALAARIPATTALACLRILWDLKTRIRIGDDPRTNLHLAIAVLGDTLTPRTPPPPAPAPAPPARLTLADMAGARR